MSHEEQEHSLQTLAVRAGQIRSDQREHAEALYPSSSFVFDNAEQAMLHFTEQVKGNVYARFTNPTVQMFERRLAAMEGAERCIGTASGMAAVQAIAFGLLQSGDRAVLGHGMFGSTTALFNKYLTRFGIEVDFVPMSDLDAWAKALSRPAKLVWVETPTNPVIQLVDIRALSKLSQQAGALLAVDNTFCTPALQNPLALGADLVMHSTTKGIDGQGRCVGGAVLGSEALVGTEIYTFLKTTGACMSPFNAWVFVKGLETLPLRMREQSHSAQQLAEWLERQPQVTNVNYPGLNSHPQHALAREQQRLFGSTLSFDVRGGREQAWAVLDALALISRSGNLGDAKSMMTHPPTTTHSRLTEHEREQAGIKESLLRLSVGLEGLHDLQADLAQALATLD